jgi:hypothetical protein
MDYMGWYKRLVVILIINLQDKKYFKIYFTRIDTRNCYGLGQAILYGSGHHKNMRRGLPLSDAAPRMIGKGGLHKIKYIRHLYPEPCFFKA